MKKNVFLLLLPLLFCSDSFSFLYRVKAIHSDQITYKKNGISFQYDLSHPRRKWILPHELKEISGQAWIDSDHLLVIEDLHAILYLLRLDTNVVIEKKNDFWDRKGREEDKFDIEDVTVVKNTAYALWSHGDIYKIKNWLADPKTKKIKTGLSKENNTEGLCYDPVSKNLLIACKNESDVSDEKRSTRAIYAFDLKEDTLITEPFLLIHKKDFEKVADEKLQFFPSAVAVHPITHDIYILSTKENKCLAQYSYKGKLRSLQFIDKEMMQQPEGLCFAPDGTLYISTEGKHGVPAAIYEFNFLEK